MSIKSNHQRSTHSQQARLTGWVRALLASVLFIIFLLVIAIFFALVMPSEVARSQGTPSVFDTTSLDLIIVVQKLFELFCLCALLQLLMRKLDRLTLLDLGLRWQGRGKDLLGGAAIAILTIFIGYIVLLLLDEIHHRQVIIDIPQIAIMMTIPMLAAIAEEMLFRGYILRNLMQSCNPYLALVISALVFSLFHGLNPNLSLLAASNIVLGGMMLGLAYIHTTNLWFPIGLHCGWNFAQTFLGFNVSGTNSYSPIEFSITQHTILNGGDFGYEGSILATLSMLIIIFAIGYCHRAQPTLSKH